MDSPTTASTQWHTADQGMVLTKRCLPAELDRYVRDCCGFGFELKDVAFNIAVKRKASNTHVNPSVTFSAGILAARLLALGSVHQLWSWATGPAHALSAAVCCAGYPTIPSGRA